VPDPARPGLVLDLDSTILDRSFEESLRLYLGRTLATGRIFPGAAEAILGLSARAEVVAVTARWSLCRANTRRWLEAHGLGFMPAVHSPVCLGLEWQRAWFKSWALRRLKGGGLCPAFGVGDRASDLDAYLGEGLFPVLVGPHPAGRKHRALLRRIERLRLEAGRDYVLFVEQADGPPLWARVGPWLEAALAAPSGPARR